jgi:hypothetical protein
VHGDGTLSNRSIEIVSKHFVNAKIIRRDDADAQMQGFLKGHTHLQKFRSKKDFHCALKLLDILFYSTGEQILVLDSDILFFKYPNQIIDGIEQEKPFFNSDYQSAYVKGASKLFKAQNISLLPNVNAGLLFLNKVFYLNHLSFMDEYFAKVASYPPPRNINVHEQTLHAIMMSKSNATRLGENYQISRTDIGKETVGHHFVNDGSRDRFYTDGLRHLEKNNFIELSTSAE